MVQQVSLLIVDDDEELCQSLCDVFQEAGYNVETAYSGMEAVRRSAAKYFNIALIDIRLLNISGLELLDILKKLHPEIEGIIITGYASLETAVEALHRGAAAYVIKPLKMDEVFTTIEEVLNKQRATLERQELVEQEIEVKEFYRSLSTIDELTGLYNFRHFHELLSQELTRAKRYSRPISFLMLDIDKFKAYQDVYGHLAGDTALKAIAHTMKNGVRGADIVARYGGEEFAILLPETTKSNAITVAERLRKAIAEITLHREGKLTVSIGVAAYPEDTQGEEQLISYADQALYQAKQAGRNQVHGWAQRGEKSNPLSPAQKPDVKP
jgi:diguanylate cyclase (GGDEF)-like protein